MRSYMQPGTGFWKRPTGRTYSYNLDLGEHYYHPMTSYLDSSRGFRGETPGALTYSERLARRWLYGSRYGAHDLTDRYYRAASLEPVGISSAYMASRDQMRSARASSEMRSWARETTPPFDLTRDPYNVSAFGGYGRSRLEMANQLRADSLNRQQAMAARRASAEMSVESVTERNSALRNMLSQRSAMAAQQQQQQQQQQKQESIQIVESRRRVDDDILKRISDVHISPFAKGEELEQANYESAMARTRIQELERELEDITKKALTVSSHQRHTASQLAQMAMAEEDAAAASSYRKSKKVMVESSAKVGA